jgi:Mn-dependent DtxR family transcriptional regulator
MDYHELWTLMHEAWAALRIRYQPIVQQFIHETGIESRAWGLLLAALTIEPEGITPAHLMVRGPYTAADEYLRRLKSLAEKGYLQEVEDGGFVLTSRGRDEARRLITDVRQAMASVDPLPPRDLQRLVELLDRLVQNCLNTPPPPDTWSIRLSYKLMPPLSPPLPFIEQAFSCLEAYRDDSHLAAWRGSSLTATSLEALTLIWRGEANSLSSLIEKLEWRGHSPDIYRDAIHHLKSRGLINGPMEALQLTLEGKKLRDEIEEKTDRYFYAPWVCLNAAEANEMKELLVHLRDGLK